MFNSKSVNYEGLCMSVNELESVSQCLLNMVHGYDGLDGGLVFTIH